MNFHRKKTAGKCSAPNKPHRPNRFIYCHWCSIIYRRAADFLRHVRRCRLAGWHVGTPCGCNCPVVLYVSAVLGVFDKEGRFLRQRHQCTEIAGRKKKRPHIEDLCHCEERSDVAIRFSLRQKCVFMLCKGDADCHDPPEVQVRISQIKDLDAHLSLRTGLAPAAYHDSLICRLVPLGAMTGCFCLVCRFSCCA